MAKYTGKDLVIAYGGTTVKAYGRKVTIPETCPVVDTTCFGEDDRSKLSSAIKDKSADLEMLDDSTPGNMHDAFVPGTDGTLEVWPQGTASGKPKRTCNSALVQDRQVEYPFDDVVKTSVHLELSGALTDSTVA